ncbi:synthase [Streptococcus oralis]|uniref:synthase n=1 Tax=Streptococcus oralis TaxID=1303 RepID=UPI0022842CFD|nr:synthase [Streptococcus oralis]MCY7070616.1 synthase [Streptococcus oralis]
MIFGFIVLFVVGVCISFSGVFIIAKNTDIHLDWSGEKDFFFLLSPWEWMLSIFLILVGGGMMYFSCKELVPYFISVLDFKL